MSSRRFAGSSAWILWPFVLTLGSTGLAQDPRQTKLDRKLQEAWVKNAAWITDFGKAKAAARRTGKQIFAYYTRSYAP